jgi:hypothetical protein
MTNCKVQTASQRVSLRLINLPLQNTSTARGFATGQWRHITYPVRRTVDKNHVCGQLRLSHRTRWSRIHCSFLSLVLWHLWMASRYSSVNIVTLGRQLDSNESWFESWQQSSVPTGSEPPAPTTRATSYTKGNRDAFLGGKTFEAWNWQLPPSGTKINNDWRHYSTPANASMVSTSGNALVTVR